MVRSDLRAKVIARLTRVTDWDKTDSLKRPDGRLEATGGCDRWRLGLLTGGGSADVAGWVGDWQLEETGGCGRRTLGG